MWLAVISNIPELILGGTWTAIVFLGGMRFGRWRFRRA